MTTLVTGFWDLSSRGCGSHRSAQEYLVHSEYVLSLDINLVVFIDPTFREFVSTKRQNQLDKTRIIEMSFDQLPYASLLPDVKEIRDECVKGGSYNKHTPDYLVVIWSKMPLLSQVCRDNPFKSTHFGWIDFGIRHVAMLPIDDIYSSSCDIIRIGQVGYFGAEDVDINKLSRDALDKGDTVAVTSIAAGIFMGSRYHMMLLNYLFDEELDFLLDKRWAFNEQFIFARLILRYPDFFSIYFAQYSTLLLNHRYLRGAKDHVVAILNCAYDRIDHTTACRVGQYFVDSCQHGAIPPDETFAFVLDKYYTSAYYYYHPDQKVSRSIVQLFNELKATSIPVKSYYDAHASRLDSNFSFLRKE